MPVATKTIVKFDGKERVLDRDLDVQSVQTKLSQQYPSIVNYTPEVTWNDTVKTINFILKSSKLG